MAADSHFKKLKVNEADEAKLRNRLGLKSSFLLYTGGIDFRKNIEKLIEAYGLLPKLIRDKHQLAIVCSIRDEDRKRLGKLVRKSGLDAKQVVFTGFVSEADLAALYGLCKLFIFPSWHDRFGLPVLEAVKCGAPVIASSLSSLPETVREPDAMFDPHDANSIADKMRQALTDEAFRTCLIKNSQKRARQFHWDDCGLRAIQAMEAVFEKRKVVTRPAPAHRPKLAFVSPLPPAKSGIADYSAELIPELSKYYEIHLFVKDDVQEAKMDGVPNTYPVKKLSELLRNWRQFDRILYHFGNSDHHDAFFDALKMTSGVVVLHDFYLGNILQHMDLGGQKPGCWVQAIHNSHGLQGVSMLQDPKAVWRFPANFQIFEDAKHIILHSPNTFHLAHKWYGSNAANKCSVIPLLRVPASPLEKNRAVSRKILGLHPDEYVVCTFGFIGPAKMSHNIFDAWHNSKFNSLPNCRLVFVGQTDGGKYGAKLAKDIRSSGSRNATITGWLNHETFRHWLAAADVAVQLRTDSRGETSAAILDCMNYGLPIIANAVGSMKDIPKDCLVMLEERVSKTELIKSLESLHKSPQLRSSLGQKADRHLRSHHNPGACAKRYAQVIESAYLNESVKDRFVVRLAELSLSQKEIVELCESAASALEVTPKRLFVDVSAIAAQDLKTGIQRVVRNLLKSINALASCRVIPIRFDRKTKSFRHARSFSHDIFDNHSPAPHDSIVSFTERDEVLFLDFTDLPSVEIECLNLLRYSGIRTHCFVHDLLPLKWPKFFPAGTEARHFTWAKWMATCDSALCISQSVASDVRAFVEEHAPGSKIQIMSFPPGSTLDRKNDAKKAKDFSASLGLDFAKPTFLMVGTLEPRKGHADVLMAFKSLWAQGVDVNLCIVGKQGWMVEHLVKDIEKMAKHEGRLAWPKHVSDDVLQFLYEKSTCLIAASYDEGFGLPLVEAAQHDLPIIARDIPVFREVCGINASYFDNDLEKVISNWLSHYKEGKHISSKNIKPITWKDSAKSLLKLIKLAKTEIENEI
ncbi:MAG: glycosyltransferase [Pseudomonadota bacterium]|nr:glycosyltransferase [Pseudomonadota bacterium]